MNLKNLIFGVIALITIVSCTNEDTLRVENNNNFSKKMNISELDKLSLGTQKNYFRTLDYEEKINLWENKIEILINSSENNEENRHLRSILSELLESNLSNGINTEDFNTNWKPKLDLLKNRYNWSKRDVQLTFGTLYIVKFNDNKSVNRLQPVDAFDASDNCDCRTGWGGCFPDGCGAQSSCPEDRDDELGCGFFGLQSCNGACDMEL